MSKSEKFFRAMAWLCLGVVIGFLLAPIKRGIDVTIASNNDGTVFGGDGMTLLDDEMFEEDDLDPQESTEM